MEMKTKFADALLRARQRQGLTQEQAAEAVSLSVRWYQQIERGARMPGILALRRLRSFFDIDTDTDPEAEDDTDSPENSQAR